MNYGFAQALLDSLVGILVVFFALVLLMVIIKIMTAVGDSREKKAAAAQAQEAVPEKSAAAVPVEAPAKKLAPGVAGEVKLYDTEPRTAAMLMAIVADELKTPINELRFISIREIKEEA